MKKLVTLPLLGAAALTLAACEQAATADGDADTTAAAATDDPITEAEVETAQQAWGEGIVNIGRTYTDNGDYRAAAEQHIATFYGYDGDGSVLFKPTLAAEDQFREDPDQALSYFVGTEGTEDGGFAIAPYTSVRWENNGTIISESGDMATAMGNYYFTGQDGNETKVEYTFVYEKDDAGDLKIVGHHSSMPYSAT